MTKRELEGPDATTDWVAGRAPGKVIVAGEHAVVYGHPAIGFPINRSATVWLRRGSGSVQVRLATDIAFSPRPGSVTPHALVSSILGPRIESLDVYIELAVPPMSGLGSSAAIAVATVRAQSALDHRSPPSRRSSLARAMSAETIAHGRPSGVDPAIVTLGALTLFQRRGERMHTREIVPRAPLNFIVAVVGQHEGTSRAVRTVAGLRSDSTRMMAAAMTTLGETAKEAAHAAESGNPDGLGQAMNLAHGILFGLGLVGEAVDQAVKLARTHGALGAKMSGAGGGGGAVIAIAPSRKAAQRVVAALQSNGGMAWTETIRATSPPLG